MRGTNSPVVEVDVRDPDLLDREIDSVDSVVVLRVPGEAEVLPPLGGVKGTGSRAGSESGDVLISKRDLCCRK